MSMLSRTARLGIAVLGLAGLMMTVTVLWTAGSGPAPDPEAVNASVVETIRRNASLRSLLEEAESGTLSVPAGLAQTVEVEGPFGTERLEMPMAGLKGGREDAARAAAAQPQIASVSAEYREVVGTALADAPPPAGTEPRSKIETFSVVMNPGDTLMRLLTRSGVARREAYEAIQAASNVVDPRRLKAGQTVHLVVLQAPQMAMDAEGVAEASTEVTTELMGVRLNTSVDREVVVSRTDTGQYAARELVQPLEQRLARVRGTIRSSLFVSAQDLGVPASVIADFVHVLAYSVDFSREIRAGDEYEILYNQFVDDQGRVMKAGNIDFASLTTSGKRQELYRFKAPDDGVVDYFDAEGRSVRQFLMRTPVDAARISSRFGRRFHPIGKRWKNHNGVDFAAPRGTRIYAAGRGKIVYAGKGRGYGNYVKIQHSNGFETRYAHMRGFAKGIRRGRTVAQGDVIGYVGATGWATGPHLHYEVRRQRKPVDPLSVKVPTGRKLAGKALESFKARVEAVEGLKVATPLVTTTRTARINE